MTFDKVAFLRIWITEVICSFLLFIKEDWVFFHLLFYSNYTRVAIIVWNITITRIISNNVYAKIWKTLTKKLLKVSANDLSSVIKSLPVLISKQRFYYFLKLLINNIRYTKFFVVLPFSLSKKRVTNISLFLIQNSALTWDSSL